MTRLGSNWVYRGILSVRDAPQTDNRLSGKGFVKWAVQDSNSAAIPAEKPHTSTPGAAKSAADTGDSDLTEALAMIARLPLTDAEKAEAVRQLLKGTT